MSTPNRWVMLAVGMVAQAAGAVASNAPVFLIPYLHLERDLSLAQAGALATTASVGVLTSLLVWGGIVDRFGERFTLTTGLVIATTASVGAAFSSGYVALGICWFIVGIGAASSNAASGRLVVGWFPPHRRGTAMGIRQGALPLGVAIGALVVPIMAERVDLRSTLLVVAGIGAVALVLSALLVVDPPRAPRTEAAASDLANPYRGNATLARIHLSSALLVVPQITLWTFMLVWLIDNKDWSTAAAGALVAVTQVGGALGRIGAGWWSDAVNSRMGPMRLVAVAAAAIMVLLGLIEPTPAAIAVIVLATVISVADNGLAFTSVAEISGPYWSGRALGLQNTGQYIASSVVPPAMGALIASTSYAWAFGLVAVFPILAIFTIPRESAVVGLHRAPQHPARS